MTVFGTAWLWGGAGGVVHAGADHIRLSGADGSTHQVIVAGQPSAPIRVWVRDSSDNPAPVPAGTSLSFTAFDSTGASELPELSVGSAGFAVVPSVLIPTSDTETEELLFRRALSGHVTLRAQADNFPLPGQTRYAWYDFDVLASGAGFTSVRARTTSEPATSSSTVLLFTPDRDNFNDGAIFSCVPPAGVSSWQLVLSSDPSFASDVFWRSAGYGTGEVYWYGTGTEGRTVPNGVYYARFQTEGGGVVSSTLAVTVQSAGLRGIVLDGQGSPQSDVDVHVFGPLGGGFGRTNANGQFFVHGLQANSSYQMELRKNGWVTTRVSAMTGSSLGSAVDVGSQVLTPGVELAIGVSVFSAPSRDIYGSVNVHDASYTESFWANLHIASGSTQSDNGRYFT